MSEKVQAFLSNKKLECEDEIKKLKRKIKVVKIMYYTLLTASVCGQAAIAVAAPFMVIPIVLASINGATAVITALSAQFKLNKNKRILNEKLVKLKMIKDKLEFVEASNGNLSLSDCEKIMTDFRNI